MKHIKHILEFMRVPLLEMEEWASSNKLSDVYGDVDKISEFIKEFGNILTRPNPRAFTVQLLNRLNFKKNDLQKLMTLIEGDRPNPSLVFPHTRYSIVMDVLIDSINSYNSYLNYIR